MQTKVLPSGIEAKEGFETMKLAAVLALLLVSACASIRSGAFLPFDFSDQAPAILFQTECNGKKFVTRGVVVCEQKEPSKAHVAVKVPPLEGRIVYSNGVEKRTDDFNWYPKRGFIFKTKPLKDSWAPLDLGDVAAIFGDWPVAVDVMGTSGAGVINTRGVIYHIICNDRDIPCSRLVVEYECGTVVKRTGPGDIGKCIRMGGSPQAFTVKLATADYRASNRAKIYVSAPRVGFSLAREASGDEFKFEIPMVPSGPMLVWIRLAWVEGNETRRAETRILINGSNPAWTPLDQPHFVRDGAEVTWVRPVLSDLIEANLYEGGGLRKKVFTESKELGGFPLPQSADGMSCAYAWARDNSDLTALCLNSKGEIVEGTWN